MIVQCRIWQRFTSEIDFKKTYYKNIEIKIILATRPITITVKPLIQESP